MTESINLSTVLLIAGVVIAFMGAIGGIAGFFALREFDRAASDKNLMEARLQRDALLLAQNMEIKANTVDRLSTERHNALSDRMAKLENAGSKGK